MIKHKVGDKMFVRGSMSISNGSSDTTGGIATIKEIEVNERLGEDHINGDPNDEEEDGTDSN